MVRKFYLENAIGERKPLNGENGIFFINPSGLGISLAPSFADNNDGFFTKVSGSKEPQKEIVGDIVFSRHGDPYENYQTFVNWLCQPYELYFVYCPYGTNEFYRSVEINYLTKTEKEAGNKLRIPTAFPCLTPWYSLTPVESSISPDSSDYKRYPYYYPYVYPAARQDSAVQVTAIGHVAADYRLEYTGVLVNPTIKLLGVSTNEIYGECAINGTLGASDKLFYTCQRLKSQVYKEDADGVITDLIDSVDVSKEVFGRIPLREPCEITLTSSAAIINAATIKIYNYYRGV